MKKLLALLLTFLLVGAMSCASTQKSGKQAAESGSAVTAAPAIYDGFAGSAVSAGSSGSASPSGSASSSAVTLLEAIEQSAEKIAGELPKGSRVAIAAFESDNSNLSEFIIEELSGALFDRGIEVADRQSLEYVYNELEFQMSGDVDEESIKKVGKFLAADMVITGQMANLGSTYRYHTSAVHTEQATRASVTRVSVRNDREMRDMAASLAKRRTTVKTSGYGSGGQKAKPQTAGSFFDRGILFLDRRDYDMAIADFDDALKLDSNMMMAYIYRGRAHNENRDHDRAIADCDQAIRLDPDNVAAHNNRGFAHAKKGDYDKAIADCNRAIRLDPNYAAAYINRAFAHAGKGDGDKAAADYSQVIRMDPKNAIAYRSRGGVHLSKGDYNKAIADFEAALRIDPDYTQAKEDLEEARRKRGR